MDRHYDADDVDDEYDFMVLVQLMGEYINNQPLPQHNSVLTGNAYFEELMVTDNAARFMNVLRMERDTFELLVAELVTNGNLVPSMHIKVGEKVAMFMQVLVGHTIRNIAERFQHSYETVSKAIEEVLTSFDRVRNRLYIALSTVTPNIIQNDIRFSTHFGNCVGTIDGTHVSCCPPSEDQHLYRNRKGGQLTQNVLAVANFDMTFAYVLAGWEGTAHDSRVLQDAYTKGLQIEVGTYLLGDAGYGNGDKILSPYRGVR